MKTFTLTLALFLSIISFTNITPNPIKEKTISIDQTRIFTWKVKTVHGYASGESRSIIDAEKAIRLSNIGDVPKSKIIISHKLEENK